MIIFNFKKNTDIFDNVINMVNENYNDYDDIYLLVIGYNLSDINFFEFKKKYSNYKIIVYQLEQLYNNLSNWYNKKSIDELTIKRTNNTIDWLSNCDEIWEYDINNLTFLKKEGFKNIKYKPIIYTQSLKELKKVNKDIDILFYGRINSRRANFLSKIPKKYNVKYFGVYSFIEKSDINNYNIEINPSKYGNDLKIILERSKVIICPHYYDSKIQEQVRIFYLLINDKCVLVENSQTNYYDDMISEFNKDNLIEKLEFLIDKEGYKNYENVSEKFKNKKWNIKY
jgi:hypothetical protein